MAGSAGIEKTMVRRTEVAATSLSTPADHGENVSAIARELQQAGRPSCEFETTLMLRSIKACCWNRFCFNAIKGDVNGASLLSGLFVAFKFQIRARI